MKIFKKYPLALVGIIFTIVGAVALGVSIALYFSLTSFYETAVETNAIIEEIDSYVTGDDERSYDVYLGYEYDGQEYNHVHVNFYSSSMYEGQEITVFIDPEKPRDVHSEHGLLFDLIPAGLGLIFLLIGIPMLIIPICRRNKSEKLIETGLRLPGEVESIEVDYNITINMKHPYRVYCKYMDASSGYIYKFKSNPIMDFNPNADYKPGDRIDIYVNPDNYKQYYVEVVNSMADKVIDYT